MAGKRNIVCVRALCLMLLALGCVARELSQLPTFPSSLFTGTGAGTSVGSGTGASSTAGSGASVTSSGSGGGSASSAATGTTYQAQATACASAASQALAAICAGGSAVSAASVFAQACATAVVKAAVSSLATVQTTGNAVACAGSTSSASACAKAVSEAVAGAVAGTYSQTCLTYGQASVNAFAAVILEASASSFSYVCSQGKGSATAASRAQVSVLASAMAKAVAGVFAKACECGSCKCSSGGASLGTDANSRSLAVAIEGRYAVATTVSDASALLCTEKRNGQIQASTVKAATLSVVEALTNTCFKLLATYSGIAVTNGNALACTGATINSDNELLASASAEALAGAFAISFEGKCAAAVSKAESYAASRQLLKVVLDAYVNLCAAGGSGSILSVTIATQLVNSGSPLAQAITGGLAEVYNGCACQGSDWCCSSCDLSATCPGYIKY